MTKGGVMIGSTVSTRSAPLKRKPVRVAISAKARPSAVVPTPTSTARNSVFQATPQRRLAREAVEPPDRAVEELRRGTRRARSAPALSCEGAGQDRGDREEHEDRRSARRRCRSTQTTKASPRHQPRAQARGRAASGRRAAVERRAEAHAGLASAPARRTASASQASVQPLSRWRSPATMSRRGREGPPATSQPRRRRCGRRGRASGQVASSSGNEDRQRATRPAR